MNLKEIKNEHVFDKYYKTELPNGLNIYIYPKKGYNSKYVVLGTDYGSINKKFKNFYKLVVNFIIYIFLQIKRENE